MSRFVPYISTPAGACLTYDNWRELGISIVAYEFSELWMKPGIAYLQSLPNLGSFLGWRGDLVLDAGQLNRNTAGKFQIKSRYDGGLHQITPEALWELVMSLKPTMVLLPPHMRSTSQQTSAHLFEDSSVSTGEPHLRLYATHSGSEESRVICAEGCHVPERHFKGYFVSNFPASQAYQGQIMQAVSGQIICTSIMDDRWTQCFKALDEACACPTCQQPFSAAYLQHLYANTPLLCQRLLIMHNVFVFKNFCIYSP